jgi:hypothetical protein
MRLGAVTACFAAATAFGTEKMMFESAETPAILLELFTSEGCSSCPPADAWISRLNSSNELWKNVVPVVYHVDYWDRLGWRDRFAKREFTARQNRYSAQWQSGSIYTPEFVVNGREWHGWLEGEPLPRNPARRVGKLRVFVDDARRVSAAFTGTAPEPLLLQLALLATDLESNVERGENSGRKLHHDFVVIETAAANLQRNGTSYSAEVALPNERPAATPAALAAWVTPADGKPPNQATGGWLRR